MLPQTYSWLITLTDNNTRNCNQCIVSYIIQLFKADVEIGKDALVLCKTNSYGTVFQIKAEKQATYNVILNFALIVQAVPNFKTSILKIKYNQQTFQIWESLQVHQLINYSWSL